MKKLYSFLIMTVLVAIGASAKVSIYVQTSDNKAPYIWIWGTTEDLNGGLDWPGNNQLTATTTTPDGKKWFTKDFDVDIMNFLLLSDLELEIKSQDFNGVSVCGYYVLNSETGDCEDVTADYYDRPDYDTSKIPAEVKFFDGETFAYFVKPAAWAAPINVWAWDANNGNEQLSGASAWPGANIGDKIGTDKDGLDVFLWKLDKSAFPNRVPTQIIFNNGSSQTADMEFVNGGYYGVTGLLYTITSSWSGINEVKAQNAVDGNVYSIDGRIVSRNASLEGLSQGIYIMGGKKVLVK